MRLLRVGPPGSERPAVLVTDTTYVDVSDMVRDYDAEFFETGGVNDLRAVVGERVAANSVRDLAGQRVRTSGRAAASDLVHRAQLPRPRRRDAQAVPDEPVVFNKSPYSLVGPTDDVSASARLRQHRLGGGACDRHRPTLQLLARP